MAVRVPIANFKTGMNTYLQPEVLPDDGFVDIEDAVTYRGTIRKRDGYQSLIVPQTGAPITVSNITYATVLGVTTFTVTTSASTLATNQAVTILGVQGIPAVGNQQTITGITNAQICEITTAASHGYYTGQQIIILSYASSPLVGMIDPNGSPTQSPLVSPLSTTQDVSIFTITVTGAKTFTIPLNTLQLTPYVSGGTIVCINPYTITVSSPTQFTFQISNFTVTGAYVTGGIVNSAPYIGNGDANANIGIVNVSNANPAVITTQANHKLTSDQQVQIFFVEGIQRGANSSISDINNDVISPLQPYEVTVISPTTFSIPVDTTLDSAYQASGLVGQPVMGLFPQYPTADEFFPKLIAFNETQAFQYDDAIQDFIDISGATTWTGNDSQFFWATNYSGAFWATNFNIATPDPIRYYLSGTTWTNFRPQVDAAGNLVQSALLIFPYKDRLVLLNTYEGRGGTNFQFAQRARWSQNGTPFVTNPVPAGGAFDATAWRQDIVGKGGYIDAATSEQIVAAGFVRDTLVVMFTRSAWRLRYTANELLPFIWERIDSTYGSNSTWSAVTFDTGLMSVGKYGITLTTVNACERIDYQIADQIFQIQQANDGNSRVNGIRDYQRQLVYWLYPNNGTGASETQEAYYPNQVFVYNYIEQNWQLYNMQFTVFGTYRRTTAATWGNTYIAWDEANMTWGSGFDGIDNPQIISGDPFGQVMIWQPDLNDQNGQAFNWSVTTKKFNPWAPQGQQAKAIYLYMLVDGNSRGQFTIQHFIDENTDTPTEIFPGLATMVNPEEISRIPFPNPDGLTLNTNTSTGQSKVWRRVALSGTSQYHQFTFTFSQPQIDDGAMVIPFEDYAIYQIIFEMAPAGRLNYGDDNTL